MLTLLNECKNQLEILESAKWLQTCGSFPRLLNGINILLFSCLIRIRKSYYSLFSSTLTSFASFY